MTESQPEPKDPGTAHILLVGMGSWDAGRLQEALGEAGYRVSEIDSVEEALTAGAEKRGDLMIVNMTPARLDQQELWDRCQADSAQICTPMVLLGGPQTGEKTLGSPDTALVHFVAKPFKIIDLLHHVRSLLHMKELHESLLERNRDLEKANRRLEELNKELLTRNRDLEQGMEMAHRLQQAMLPQHYPDVQNVGFCHAYTPADIIGGDLFQITPIGEDLAAVFISDVSGHGLRAALVTSAVKTLYEHVDFRNKTPGLVLAEMNNRIRDVLGEMAPQIYATAVLMFVDGKNRTIRVADAGHPCPLLISKGEMSVKPIMCEDNAGPALGFIKEPEYGTEEHKLSDGDIVLGFTDGVYEVRNAEGEYYGMERMRSLIEQNTRLIPRDLIQKILLETDDYLGTEERFDDVCLVAVEIR